MQSTGSHLETEACLVCIQQHVPNKVSCMVLILVVEHGATVPVGIQEGFAILGAPPGERLQELTCLIWLKEKSYVAGQHQIALHTTCYRAVQWHSCRIKLLHLQHSWVHIEMRSRDHKKQRVAVTGSALY